MFTANTDLNTFETNLIAIFDGMISVLKSMKIYSQSEPCAADLWVGVFRSLIAFSALTFQVSRAYRRIIDFYVSNIETIAKCRMCN